MRDASLFLLANYLFLHCSSLFNLIKSRSVSFSFTASSSNSKSNFFYTFYHQCHQSLIINYPRINSGVCSSHSFWNSDLNAFRLSPSRLHHRTVDNARLPAKIYSAGACLLNCGASSPLR